ncbi:3-oxoacyl-ACP reductase FabG [Gorillibacterium massiliense]|uniref:3-oxoacyl-ACP reductase FabG n=1 Tax=Gorillibacterium massiliense TaxID=1280390 RepID=UPI0004AFDE70|nr:3-oxoacyl-ACP reductase FabG [Gorillibacterium massiliense]
MEGQKILVTGGSRGIGRATVANLAEQGATVAFTYKSNAEAAEELLAELGEKASRVFAIQADSKDFTQACQTVEKARELLGGLDGLVINAGMNRDKMLFTMSEQDWDEIMETNLKGTFNYARAVIYGFIKQQAGRIVCISSVSGLIGVPGQVNYSATKAGQIGFVRTLAKEVARFGITVNAVAPGFIATEMWDRIPEKERTRFLQEIPVHRPGSPQEVADAISFLLSPKAAYITGSTLVIDGGLSA